MQHGLESSCVDWIANLPNESAAFIYADQGFDVWLGNFRGNTYSNRHVTYSSSQHEFWKFSWDQMARYDLPAMIDMAMNVTGAKSVYYIGHSMGTSTIFAQLSQDQEFAEKIKKVYALAPVATTTHVKGPIGFMSLFERFLTPLLNLVGIDDMFPTSKLQVDIATYFCGWFNTAMYCSRLMMWFTGPESNQLNQTRMPVYLSHTPAGTSSRTVAQFAQMHNAKKFQMYDFGNCLLRECDNSNEHIYQQDKPPEYDVTKITTPIVLYWGSQDYLADPQDVKELSQKLPNLAGNVNLPHFNHMDFIWGLKAASDVYNPVYEDILHDFVNSA